MGIIRRTFVHINMHNFSHLFKTMVRPHAEYLHSIYHPNYKKDINLMENIQRRATKLVPELKNLSYPERLKKLNLPTLVYRRLRGDMIEAFKILTGHYDEDTYPKLTLHEGRATRGHHLKLKVTRSNYNMRQHYFSNRIVKPWNSLPAWVVEAPSIYTFERRLDTFWSSQELKFNFEATLNLAETCININQDLEI